MCRQKYNQQSLPNIWSLYWWGKGRCSAFSPEAISRAALTQEISSCRQEAAKGPMDSVAFDPSLLERVSPSLMCMVCWYLCLVLWAASKQIYGILSPQFSVSHDCVSVCRKCQTISTLGHDQHPPPPAPGSKRASTRPWPPCGMATSYLGLGHVLTSHPHPRLGRRKASIKLWPTCTSLGVSQRTVKPCFWALLSYWWWPEWRLLQRTDHHLLFSEE